MIRAIMHDLENLNKKLSFTVKLLFGVACLLVMWIAFSAFMLIHQKATTQQLVIDVLTSLPDTFDTATITNI